MGKTKLHVGCGGIYLEGYINIDVKIEGYSFLASERPDLVEKNKTTVDKYYKVAHSKETLHNKPQDVKAVVDMYGGTLDRDFPANSVDEIRTVQAFEHLSRVEAHKALDLWYKILKPGGIVHIDVPDFEEIARQLLAEKTEEDKEWHYRLLFGSQKNEGSFHKDGYSFAKLKRMLERHGFKNVQNIEDTLHFYPCVIVEAEK